jgi:hypothetical protein
MWLRAAETLLIRSAAEIQIQKNANTAKVQVKQMSADIVIGFSFLIFCLAVLFCILYFAS